VISRAWRIAVASAVAAIAVTEPHLPASDTLPEPRPSAFEDQALVERGVVLVRLDPKRGAARGACETLSAQDLMVTLGGVVGSVTSVERVPPPERHWLLLDVSGSVEGSRNEAKRSALQYIREVMAPRGDAGTLVTIDDDVVLAAGPSADSETLTARIDEIPAGGLSALRDGLDLVLRQVSGDRHENLILYWTDGQDTTSIATLEELLATIDRTPHATVFPIVLLPTAVSGKPWSPTGSFLHDVARRSGGEVVGSWDPRWLDRVRGWLGRRFVVTVAYPDGTPEGTLAIALRQSKCVATPLRDPFARPDPIAGEAQPAPAAWVRRHAKPTKDDDAACSDVTAAPSWERPWGREKDSLAGCLLDVIRAPAQLAVRDVRVLAPGIDALPASLPDAIEALVPPENGPSPLLVSGSALLTQRARIAASLFATRVDYRNYALARLERSAEDELAAIQRGFAREFPELPPASIAALARASRAGRRAAESARRPTDADLANVLAAWLSDVPAPMLFREWQRRLIDARIAFGPDPAATAKWTRLRTSLPRTDTTRVVAPLILIRDPETDLIGFSRIVLPRRYDESWRAEDLIPERPFALELVDRIAATRHVGERLAARGYRATRIVEESTLSSWQAAVGEPSRRVHVTVVLKAPVGAARAVLDAQVEIGDGGDLHLVRLRPFVTGDPELAALLHG
jgi:hypothetical protein